MFLQWDIRSSVQKHGKLGKQKRQFLKIVKYYDPSRLASCQWVCPGFLKMLLYIVFKWYLKNIS